MPGLVAAGTPLTYSVPVVPDNVTARWLEQAAADRCG